MRRVIVNSTPLIALANADALDLLKQLYHEILIPQAVFDEIKREPTRSKVRNSEWIHVCPIVDISQTRLYRARLHAGEVEVIILAQEQNADLVILDDQAAKMTAKFLGLTVTGTLGVLLRAKREGMIKAVHPILTKIIQDGFFISETVRQYVLEQAGEDSTA